MSRVIRRWSLLTVGMTALAVVLAFMYATTDPDEPETEPAQELLQQLLDTDQQVRARAAKLLRRPIAADDALLKNWVSAMDQSKTIVALGSIDLLGEPGRNLLESLSLSIDNKIAIAAIEALGRVGEPATLALTQVVFDRRPDVVLIALRTIASRPDAFAEAAPILVSKLALASRGTNSKIVNALVAALTELGAPSVTAIIEQFETTEVSTFVSLRFLSVLRGIGEESGRAVPNLVKFAEPVAQKLKPSFDESVGNIDAIAEQLHFLVSVLNTLSRSGPSGARALGLFVTHANRDIRGGAITALRESSEVPRALAEPLAELVASEESLSMCVTAAAALARTQRGDLAVDAVICRLVQLGAADAWDDSFEGSWFEENVWQDAKLTSKTSSQAVNDSLRRALAAKAQAGGRVSGGRGGQPGVSVGSRGVGRVAKPPTRMPPRAPPRVSRTSNVKKSVSSSAKAAIPRAVASKSVSRTTTRSRVRRVPTPPTRGSTTRRRASTTSYSKQLFQSLVATGPSILEPLMQRVEGSDDREAAIALVGLWGLREVAAPVVPRLIAAMFNSPEDRGRRIAEMLPSVSSDADTLSHVLNFYVRQANPVRARSLVGVDHPDEHWRFRMSRALNSMGRSGIAALTAQCANDSWIVRLMAMEALVHAMSTGDSRPLRAAERKALLQALVATLSSPESCRLDVGPPLWHQPGWFDARLRYRVERFDQPWFYSFNVLEMLASQENDIAEALPVLLSFVDQPLWSSTALQIIGRAGKRSASLVDPLLDIVLEQHRIDPVNEERVSAIISVLRSIGEPTVMRITARLRQASGEERRWLVALLSYVATGMDWRSWDRPPPPVRRVSRTSSRMPRRTASTSKTSSRRRVVLPSRVGSRNSGTVGIETAFPAAIPVFLDMRKSVDGWTRERMLALVRRTDLWKSRVPPSVTSAVQEWLKELLRESILSAHMQLVSTQRNVSTHCTEGWVSGEHVSPRVLPRPNEAFLVLQTLQELQLVDVDASLEFLLVEAKRMRVEHYPVSPTHAGSTSWSNKMSGASANSMSFDLLLTMISSNKEGMSRLISLAGERSEDSFYRSLALGALASQALKWEEFLPFVDAAIDDEFELGSVWGLIGAYAEQSRASVPAIVRAIERASAGEREDMVQQWFSVLLALKGAGSKALETLSQSESAAIRLLCIESSPIIERRLALRILERLSADPIPAVSQHAAFELRRLQQEALSQDP